MNWSDVKCTIAIGLMPIANALILTACTKVDAPTPEPQVTGPSVDAALDAMDRAHDDRVTKICYDASLKGFLILFKNTDPPDADPDVDYFKGWYFIDVPHFYQSSNKTWLISDIPNEKYTQVYPDIKDLPCKDKTQNSG